MNYEFDFSQPPVRGSNFREFVNTPVRKKTKVAQTSIESYEKGSPKRMSQCDIVFEAVKNGADNILRIHEITGLSEKTICGRVNDLINEGSLMYLGIVRYKNRNRKKLVCVN